MKVSTNWLKEYIDNFEINNLNDADKLAAQIGLTSSEIENVSYLVPQSSGLVVAKILDVKDNENSDHLKIVQVNNGKNNFQIVSGAPNIEFGQVVILAMVGAKLFNGKEIKETKIADYISSGMLVSLQEIGFNDSIAPKKHEEGIYVFPENADIQLGQDAIDALGANDIIVETSLTANRADMLSIKGNSYEFAAMLDTQVSFPKYATTQEGKDIDDLISVEVDSKIVSEYNLSIVQNIKVKQSPLWIQKRLWSSGIRPINNVVDVTNYVMLYTGQPLHAFDYDKLQNKQIKVSLSNDEEIQTLDGQKRELEKGKNIVIYDGNTPLMLAGVMGGISSEVDENTKNVVIEAAVFNPQLVRKTAQNFALHSEASSRFERGINLDDLIPSLNLSANLIQQLAGGQIARGIITKGTGLTNAKKLEISLSFIQKKLGLKISTTEISSVLNRLNFEFKIVEDKFIIEIPNRRWDISIPEDIVEEVARIHGYDKIPTTLPQAIDPKSGLTIKQKLLRNVNEIMRSSGFNQAISYSLLSKNKVSNFSTFNLPAIKLAHPMSEDRAYLRQSLIASLLEALKYNVSRSQKDIHLFEHGIVFAKNKSQNIEQLHLAGLVMNSPILNWKNNKKEMYDFFDLKCDIEDLLNLFEVDYKFIKNKEIKLMHPEQTANIVVSDQIIGFIGKIHPEYLQENKLEDIYAFELDLDKLFDIYQPKIGYQLIPKYQEVTRDLSLQVAEDVTSDDILNVINKLNIKELKKIELFDKYKDSLTYRFTFNNEEKTMEIIDTNEIMELVQKNVSALNVKIR
ncbi:MAG: phenylalanine--tRNA ligase subunit beta [Lactobacillaceae bacterium]|jgi:phenylalanyl-tRNA synthetase beta chain|nr:phenylalanine--tRNA ligase subunit beta [Lactobacillaceae bacterium]